jgi:putative peptidoglycan lipid II flippase
VSDADRERELRRLERDRLRRERGAPTYFAPSTLLGIGPDDPTVNLRPAEFRAAVAAADEHPPRRRLGTSTAIFGAATGLSRVLGLAREVIASYYFGTAGKINAFTIAFQFPNLVRALVADAALSSAFVPVFVDLLKKDPKRAWRVASSLFWLMLLGLTALSALFILISPWAIGVFGNPGHDRTLAVGLTRILFPVVALLRDS